MDIINSIWFEKSTPGFGVAVNQKQTKSYSAATTIIAPAQSAVDDALACHFAKKEGRQSRPSMYSGQSLILVFSRRLR